MNNSHSHKTTIILIIAIFSSAISIAALVFTCLTNKTNNVESPDKQNHSPMQMAEMNYTESTKLIESPECGIISKCFYVNFMPDDDDSVFTISKGCKCVHIFCGLAYSSYNAIIEANGKAFVPQMSAMNNYCWTTSNKADDWIPLSDEYLAQLSTLLQTLRENGTSAVIRFNYDNAYGYADCEPPLEGILYHISQLKPIFEEYQDVLFCVESGFYGPFGEQWGSSALSDSSNLNAVIDALCDAVPYPITISFRTPRRFAAYLGLSVKELPVLKSEKGSNLYRIGYYDDGMFGSSSDLGTFDYSREDGISCIAAQTSHAIFGGEVAGGYSGDESDSSSFSFAMDEIFKTHTAYMNGISNSWASEICTDEYGVYSGLNGKTYLQNHLGYHFYCTDSTYTLTKNELKLTFDIANVGAGNSIKPKTVQIVLVNKKTNNRTIKTLECDTTDWISGETIRESCTILKNRLADGFYKVYIKVTDSLGNQIELANDYDLTVNGNYIGEIAVDSHSLKSDF